MSRLVEFAEHLAGQRLLGMAAGDSQRAAVDADPHAERLLDRADVRVVLAEQIGKQAMVVEMEFERIFGG